MENTYYSVPTFFLEWDDEVVPVGYGKIADAAKAWCAIELKAAGLSPPPYSSNYEFDLALFYNRAAVASTVEGKFVQGKWFVPPFTHDH